MPRILPATPQNLNEAAEALRAGRLVAFPTETVYGLGADAGNDLAAARIYEAKGRPSFNPLIVHVPSLDAAESLAEIDDRARALLTAFWPGPLTAVLRRRPDSPVSRLVSAGLETLAVRCPNHTVALALLRLCGRPLAAPSANRSGRISPTQPCHVVESLKERIDIILDGGPCSIGIESTILDLTTPQPALLRPGGVDQQRIEALLGFPLATAPSRPDAPVSPGQLLSHYAPSLPLRLNAVRARPGEALLGFGPTLETVALNLSVSGDPTEAAANLFAMLHALDRSAYSGIAVMPIPMHGLGLAVNDRLTRAAAPRPNADSSP